MPPHRLVLSSGLVILVFVLQSTLALAQTTVIRATRMLDVASGEIRKPGVVVIESDRIRAVNPSIVPSGATVIELGDATLLPGLMDMHIHLMDEPGTDWIRQRAYETPATWALRGARNARLALQNGFTTVRDLGSTGFVDVALARATDQGWIEGPQIFPVGHYITITGGHCDLTGFAPGILEQRTRGGPGRWSRRGDKGGPISDQPRSRVDQDVCYIWSFLL